MPQPWVYSFLRQFEKYCFYGIPELISHSFSTTSLFHSRYFIFEPRYLLMSV